MICCERICALNLNLNISLDFNTIEFLLQKSNFRSLPIIHIVLSLTVSNQEIRG